MTDKLASSIYMLDRSVSHIDTCITSGDFSPSSLESLHLARAAVKAALQGLSGEDCEILDLTECYWDVLNCHSRN